MSQLYLVGLHDLRGKELAHLFGKLRSQVFSHGVSVRHNLLVTTEGGQDGQECVHDSFSSWATGRIIQTIAEELGVFVQVGHDQNAHDIGASNGLHSDDRTVVGTEWLGWVKEGLQARAHKARLEHVGGV